MLGDCAYHMVPFLLKSTKEDKTVLAAVQSQDGDYLWGQVTRRKYRGGAAAGPAHLLLDLGAGECGCGVQFGKFIDPQFYAVYAFLYISLTFHLKFKGKKRFA